MKQRIALRVAGPIVAIGILALAGFAGCSNGENTPTGSSGSATLQGQILREPAVQLAGAATIPEKIWMALAIRSAWASGHRPAPAANMRIDLMGSGHVVASTTSDSYGRFRFEGMSSGMYSMRIQDSSGRYGFDHDMSMDAGQISAAYGVVWMSGGTAQMTWGHESGDHWDEMMRGVPAERWDMGSHGWGMGMM